MSTPRELRSRRRNAAQWHALVSLQRELQATDPNGRRKYLREFNQAFRDYQEVLTAEQVRQELLGADVVLVGDYHALPGSQRYAAALLEQLASSGRSVVLGLETVFARDQHILDEWRRGEIDDDELQERIRFDLDWGYEWTPFLELLQAARRQAAWIYGLDCMPRDDLRKIAARDRHAAQMIAELRQRHPEDRVVVLFGESHLAPNHIPQLLREGLPQDRLVTVLQNIDPLYFKATGERQERVEAVRVSDDILCVFNATPLEKYESYRLCIERWREARRRGPDLAPTLYNLVDALAQFLNIDKYAAHNHRQPRYLVDLMPEVYSRAENEPLLRLLQRRAVSEAERKQVAERLESAGCCYVPRLNAVLVREFNIAAAAEEAARFVHRACAGSPPQDAVAPADEQEAAEQVFYGRVMEKALAWLGSRVLCPDRPAVREADLYALYAQPREAVEEQTIYGYREYMQMIDFLVLHKDYEANARQYVERPELIDQGVRLEGEKFEFLSERLGYMLGGGLYDAYIAGRVSKRYLRALFFRRIYVPGAARRTYFEVARRIRAPRGKLVS